MLNLGDDRDVLRIPVERLPVFNLFSVNSEAQVEPQRVVFIAAACVNALDVVPNNVAGELYRQ